MGERSVYDWAEEYREKGYQVIPIEEGGKKPLIQWQRYQKEKVTSDLLKQWFPAGDSPNIAVVTGTLSGTVVIDFDPRHYDPKDPGPTLSYGGDPVTTGGGGVHWYCYHNESALGNYAGVFPGCDIRGEGGYVVSPPSKTTGPYKFLSDVVPEIASLPTLGSTGILEYLEKTKKEKYQLKDIPKRNTQAGSFMRLQFLPAREGERNHSAARMAGGICRSGAGYVDGLHILQLWNHSHCHPSLDSDELELVWRSIYNKHNKVKGSIGNYTRTDKVTGQPPPE